MHKNLHYLQIPTMGSKNEEDFYLQAPTEHFSQSLIANIFPSWNLSWPLNFPWLCGSLDYRIHVGLPQEICCLPLMPSGTPPLTKRFPWITLQHFQFLPNPMLYYIFKSGPRQWLNPQPGSSLIQFEKTAFSKELCTDSTHAYFPHAVSPFLQILLFIFHIDTNRASRGRNYILSFSAVPMHMNCAIRLSHLWW